MIEYNRPILLFHPHLETIFPSLLRTVNLGPYLRERISTPDNDFLDLDWLKQGSPKLVIISHGLEGNASRAYVRGMARAFFNVGYDILAWNYRGCSEEMNRNFRFYHSGATDDLDVVVQHAARNQSYNEIYLIGFSLGGNITLKYLGETGTKHHPAIKKAIAFSVPMDLYSSCLKISSPSNGIYSKRFLKSLKDKIIQKAKILPGFSSKGIDSVNSLFEFDDQFTAPLHGFKNAMDYYTQSSSIHFIKNIRTPTLIVSAKNDPFLSKECFPSSSSVHNPALTMNFPDFGGHVGFTLFFKNGLYWSELQALDFIQSN